MITSHEKQRLMEQHRTDPLATKGVALKCAVCVAALALIASIGVQTRDHDDNTATARHAGVSASIADSRRITEERRARFDRRKDASSGAIAAPLPNDAAGSREHEPAIDEMILLRRSSD